MVNTDFSLNTAENGGAVAALADSKNIVVSGGEFTENNALYGGTIYVDDATIEVSEAQFGENIADLDGGVFYLDNAKNVVITKPLKNITPKLKKHFLIFKQ